MTDNEIKILLRLNKSRSQNNVDDVLSEELEIPKYDVGQAIDSLLQKGFVYEDSNTNQKELGLKAWKITRDGELKVNELTSKEKITNMATNQHHDKKIGTYIFGSILLVFFIYIFIFSPDTCHSINKE